jgi:HSP20 family protein
MAQESKRRESRSLASRDLWRDQWLSPWRRSWTDQMDRFFNSFGLGTAGNRIGDWDIWSPEVETFQRGNELVVRADLPGMSKDQINVEVTDDAVVIQGERREESEDEREGFYRSERRYGSFYRTIPLPEGAIAENAKATFKDGVLEITMPTPPREVSRGRRIEIGEGTTTRNEARSGDRAASSGSTGTTKS